MMTSHEVLKSALNQQFNDEVSVQPKEVAAAAAAPEPTKEVAAAATPEPTKEAQPPLADGRDTLQHLQAVHKQMPNLPQLDMGRFVIHPSLCLQLALRVASFRQLQILRLAPPRSLPFWQMVAKQCPKLTKLVLLACPTVNDTPRLPVICKEMVLPPSLTSLVVKQPLDPAIFCASDVLPLPELSKLKLLKSAAATDNDVEAALSGFESSLKSLVVHSHYATGSGLTSIYRCKLLRSLSLVGTHWELTILASHLSTSHAPKLRALQLLVAESCVTPEAKQEASVVVTNWSTLLRHQTQLAYIHTNLIRDDATLDALTTLGKALKSIAFLDAIPGLTKIVPKDPFHFSHAGWQSFFTACSAVETWIITSHRDTGLTNLASCLPSLATDLCLRRVHVKLDGQVGSNLLADNEFDVRLQLTPSSVFRHLEELHVYGNHSIVPFAELHKITEPILADPLSLLITRDTLTPSVVPQYNSEIHSATLVLTVDTLQRWTKAAAQMALPNCHTLSLSLLDDRSPSSPPSAAGEVNVDAWLAAMANGLPSLTSLSVISGTKYGLQNPFRITDEGLTILAEACPQLARLDLIWKGDDELLEGKELALAVSTKGLKQLSQLPRLGYVCVYPSTLTMHDVQLIKEERTDLWAKSPIAPEPLHLHLGSTITLVV